MDGKLDQWKKLANSEVKRMGKTVNDLVSKTLVLSHFCIVG